MMCCWTLLHAALWRSQTLALTKLTRTYTGKFSWLPRTQKLNLWWKRICHGYTTLTHSYMRSRILWCRQPCKDKLMDSEGPLSSTILLKMISSAAQAFKNTGSEQTLSGLPLTADQLFYVAWAQVTRHVFIARATYCAFNVYLCRLYCMYMPAVRCLLRYLHVYVRLGSDTSSMIM